MLMDMRWHGGHHICLFTCLLMGHNPYTSYHWELRRYSSEVYHTTLKAFSEKWFPDVGSSVTRLGDFWKVWWYFLFKKCPKLIMTFLGLSEKHNSLVKTTLAPFWPTFGKTWATFYSNIWSLWLKERISFHH